MNKSTHDTVEPVTFMYALGSTFVAVAAVLLLGGLIGVVFANEVWVLAIMLAVAVFTQGIGFLAASRQ
jgi:hypothetical protein